MGNWLYHADLKKSLFLERYSVYLGAGASPGPGQNKGPEAQKAPEAKENKDNLKSNADQLNNRIDDSLQWIEKTRDTIKKSPYKSKPKIKEIDKKLGEIHKKLDAIYRKAQENKSEVRKVVLQKFDEIMTIYSKAQKVSGGKIDIESPEDFAFTKEKVDKKEGKEKVDKNPKKRLTALVNIIENKGFSAFKKHKGEIVKLIDDLSIKETPEDKTKFMKVGEDVRIAHVTWPKKTNVQTKFVIYKGDRIIGYAEEGANGKKELRYAQPLELEESPSRNRRAAEILRCNGLLEESMGQTTHSKEKKHLVFTSQKALSNLQSAIIGLGEMSASKWQSNFGSFDVTFNRKSPHDGVFKIKKGDTIIRVSSAYPDEFTIETGGKKRNVGREDLTFDKEEQKRFDNKQERKKVRQETIKKQRERKKQQGREKRKAQELLKKKTNKLINPEFKRLIKKTDKPNSFTVKAEKKDRRGLRLIDKTPIHKLLKLSKNEKQMITITIKGAPGKPERKALYYPGQKTAYRIDAKGNQTGERVKFYNNDTIAVDFKKPTEKAYKTLNGDTENVILNKEAIKVRDMIYVFDSLAKTFKEKKGTVKDLNFKPLEKFKEYFASGKYKEASDKDSLRDSLGERSLKQAGKIIKVMNDIYRNGIKKLDEYAAAFDDSPDDL